MLSENGQKLSHFYLSFCIFCCLQNENIDGDSNQKLEVDKEEHSSDEDDEPDENATIFVKNLNFETTEDAISKVMLMHMIEIRYCSAICIFLKLLGCGFYCFHAISNLGDLSHV